ncbi:hypothetical protein ANO11243_088960 [Dothideomycetidae sp. 11243]|nr:hypothetical protein ANO11243_088960 [fungal sp. No.11243]
MGFLPWFVGFVLLDPLGAGMIAWVRARYRVQREAGDALEKGDGDGKIKLGAQTGQDGFRTVGVTTLVLAGLIWLAAVMWVRLGPWSASSPGAWERKSSSTLDLWFVLWAIGTACGAVCYLRSTWALAWEGSCAMASMTLFAIYRLSVQTVWETRLVDSAFAFFAMTIGLFVGFLTGPA